MGSFLRKKHCRVIALIIVFLFILFSIFIPVYTAYANPGAFIPLSKEVIAIIGTILGMAGISFASTADLTVGTTGFFKDLERQQEFSIFCTLLNGGGLVTNGNVNLRELGGALSGGWSYFWEHANEYFGVTSGVSASVPSTLFDSALQLQFSDISFNVPVSSESSLVGLTDAQMDTNAPYFECTYNADIGLYVTEIFSVPLSDGSVFRYGWVGVGKLSHEFFYTLDNWQTRKRLVSQFGYGSAFYDEAIAKKMKVYYSVDYTADGFMLFLRTHYSTYPNGSTVRDPGYLFNTGVLEGQDFFDGFGDLLAKLRGDDVIMPGYDEAAGTYAGQDVFGVADDLIENTEDDILIDIGYLTGALEDGIAKDNVIDIPVDDVIPKDIIDILDKDIPDVTDPDKPVDPDNPTNSDDPTKPNLPNVPPGFLLPSLANKFPFCVPFDLIAMIKVFNAEPKPIVVEFPLKIEMINFEYTFVFDFTDFEPLSNFCRIFFTLDFILFLILITRKIIGA